MMSYTRPWVKDSTLVVYTSPAMFLGLTLLGEDHGTVEILRGHAGNADAEASMVRILFTSRSANRRLNSFPISANSSTSIWWLRKLYALSQSSTSVPFTFPSLRMRSFKSSMA